MYLCLILACTLRVPAFFLIDTSASMRDKGKDPDAGLGFLLMYTLSPERLVAVSLCGPSGINSDAGLTLVLLLGFAADVCAVVQFVLGALYTITDGAEGAQLPLGLAISCSAAAISAVSTLILTMLVSCCRHRFGKHCNSD